jgi:putative salt-induced outer membrane protein YdiY
MWSPAAVVAAVLAGAAILAAPSSASAQIVNVQGALAGDIEPGWSGKLTGTLDWRTGNTDLVQVGGSASVTYRCGPRLALAILRAEYGEGNGTKLSQKTFEHLRGRQELGGRWLWEAFGQHEYDAFRRLSVRALAGTGPAVRLIKTGKTRLLAGVAYMFELERLDRRAGVSDAGKQSIAHRASTYLTGAFALDEDRVTASQTLYVQPRLDDPSDLRLLSETSITTKLSSRLTLTNRLVIAHDASPPDQIEKLDSALKVELGLSL